MRCDVMRRRRRGSVKRPFPSAIAAPTHWPSELQLASSKTASQPATQSIAVRLNILLLKLCFFVLFP